MDIDDVLRFVLLFVLAIVIVVGGYILPVVAVFNHFGVVWGLVAVFLPPLLAFSDGCVTWILSIAWVVFVSIATIAVFGWWFVAVVIAWLVAVILVLLITLYT